MFWWVQASFDPVFVACSEMIHPSVLSHCPDIFRPGLPDILSLLMYLQVLEDTIQAFFSHEGSSTSLLQSTSCRGGGLNGSLGLCWLCVTVPVSKVLHTLCPQTYTLKPAVKRTNVKEAPLTGCLNTPSECYLSGLFALFLISFTNFLVLWLKIWGSWLGKSYFTNSSFIYGSEKQL